MNFPFAYKQNEEVTQFFFFFEELVILYFCFSLQMVVKIDLILSHIKIVRI